MPNVGRAKKAIVPCEERTSEPETGRAEKKKKKKTPPGGGPWGGGPRAS